MTELLGILDALAGSYGVSGLLLLLALVLALYVKTTNYRRTLRDTFSGPCNIDLLDSEQTVDRIDVVGPLISTRSVLTNRRIAQLRLSWLLPRHTQLTIALADVHSIAFRRGMMLVVLTFGGFALVSGMHPVGYLLILTGLDLRIATVTFATPFALMPLTRIVIASPRIPQTRAVKQFFANAQVVWAQVRAEQALALPARGADVPTPGQSDFRFGFRVWCATLTLMAVAMVQRGSGAHVWFDTLWVTPIYLATPAVIGRLSRRDGAWAALVSLVGILTIKFPTVGLASLFANDGGAPAIGQYAAALLTLILISELANALVRAGQATLSCVAPVLWLLFVTTVDIVAVPDLRLFAQVAGSVALAAIGGMVLRPYSARQQGE